MHRVLLERVSGRAQSRVDAAAAVIVGGVAAHFVIDATDQQLDSVEGVQVGGVAEELVIVVAARQADSAPSIVASGVVQDLRLLQSARPKTWSRGARKDPGARLSCEGVAADGRVGRRFRELVDGVVRRGEGDSARPRGGLVARDLEAFVRAAHPDATSDGAKFVVDDPALLGVLDRDADHVVLARDVVGECHLVMSPGARYVESDLVAERGVMVDARVDQVAGIPLVALWPVAELPETVVVELRDEPPRAGARGARGGGRRGVAEAVVVHA